MTDQLTGVSRTSRHHSQQTRNLMNETPNIKMVRPSLGKRGPCRKFIAESYEVDAISDAPRWVYRHSGYILTADRFHVGGLDRGRRALNKDAATLLQRSSQRAKERGSERSSDWNINLGDASSSLLRARYQK